MVAALDEAAAIRSLFRRRPGIMEAANRELMKQAGKVSGAFDRECRRANLQIR